MAASGVRRGEPQMKPMDLSQLRPNVGIVLIARRPARCGSAAAPSARPPHNWQFPARRHRRRRGRLRRGRCANCARRPASARCACWAAPATGWATSSRPSTRARRSARAGAGRSRSGSPRVRGRRGRDRPRRPRRGLEFDAWRWAELEEALDERDRLQARRLSPGDRGVPSAGGQVRAADR